MAKARNSSSKSEEPTAAEPTAAAPEAPQVDLADRVGQRIGRATASALRGIFRVAGRVREEAEDIWAEAQALRHREAQAAAASTPAKET